MPDALDQARRTLAQRLAQKQALQDQLDEANTSIKHTQGSFQQGLPNYGDAPAPPSMEIPAQPNVRMPNAQLPIDHPNWTGKIYSMKRGGRVKNSEGEDDLKEERDPAAKHHNPKMKTDEPAKLAMGGMAPMQGMPPTPPVVRNTMTPPRGGRGRRPMPIPMQGARPPMMKDGGSAGEHEAEEGDHAGADEHFPKGHHKKGGAICDFKKGGKAYKKGGSADPAMHNAKVTDSAKHGDEGGGPGSVKAGSLKDGGFKRGGHVNSTAHIVIKKADAHPGKKIGDNGPIVKKFKGGGAVKGHHDEGFKSMHETHGAGHHGKGHHQSHDHKHMVHAERKMFGKK
jgi:hypothetical protein